MRWLAHGDLTAAAIEALKRHGHHVLLPADVGLTASAPPTEVLETARVRQLEVVTTDASIAEPPFQGGARFGRVIVLLNVEAGDVEQDDGIDRLFERYKRLSAGRLYTVTGSRVKIRQLPGH